ncbi:DUF2304 domain-containing protein [Paenibacillus sp. FSL H8-0261]|uniref:DUF2304 domain-containing protein n=1 Tax=Paenibacillus sp. FSL H8-0261 TaxID=2921381 RepID=UPI00324FAC90
MIELKLQLTLIISSLLVFIVLMNMIRKYRLELKYALIWLAMSLLIIILAIFPGISVYTAHSIGIETPVNVLFLLFILSNLTISFSMTIVISKNASKITKLTQELGLIKMDIEQLKSYQIPISNEQVEKYRIYKSSER